MNDIRATNNNFTLDKNGFQFLRHVARQKTFDNEEQDKKAYHAEIEQLMLERCVVSNP